MRPKQYRHRLIVAARAEIRRREKLIPLLCQLDPEVLAALSDCFSNDVGAVYWLCAPAYGLRYKVPLLVARTKSGRNMVIHLLRAIHYNIPP